MSWILTVHETVFFDAHAIVAHVYRQQGTDDAH